MRDYIRESPPAALVENGIEFFPVPHLSGVTARRHCHPALELIYVSEGRMVIDIEKRSPITAETGDLVLIHTNEIHAITNISDAVGMYYVLKLSPPFLFSVLHKTGIPHILPFFRSRHDDQIHISHADMPPTLLYIWQSMIDEYWACLPADLAMQRHWACLLLLTYSRHFAQGQAQQIKQSGHVDERAVRLISESLIYINENFAKPLTAEHCAEAIHLSYSYYAKLFREVVGKSFREYLTDIRMTTAYNLLLSSTMSGAEIARSCGYENHTHFIVAFKKFYSCTPGDLRKKHGLKQADA